MLCDVHLVLPDTRGDKAAARGHPGKLEDRLDRMHVGALLRVQAVDLRGQKVRLGSQGHSHVRSMSPWPHLQRVCPLRLDQGLPVVQPAPPLGVLTPGVGIHERAHPLHEHAGVAMESKVRLDVSTDGRGVDIHLCSNERGAEIHVTQQCQEEPVAPARIKGPSSLPVSTWCVSYTTAAEKRAHESQARYDLPG